jgi:hypothetical protein
MIVHKDKNKNAAFSLNSIWKNSPTADQGGEFVESCGPGRASWRCLVLVKGGPFPSGLARQETWGGF